MNALIVISLLGQVSGEPSHESIVQSHKCVPKEAIVQIKSASDARKLDQALYTVVGNARWYELARLKTHQHQGVALQAAWEDVIRLVGPRHPKANKPRLDRTAVTRFLGFVEGRLGVELPDWWEESVAGARAELGCAPFGDRTAFSSDVVCC